MCKKKKLQKENAKLNRQLESLRLSAYLEPDSLTLMLKQENHQLRVKKVELEEQNAKLEEQVKDLDERLQNIFKWEDRSRKQALLTLKKDISASLKLDYADYIALLKEPSSNEAFEFSKATLTHIFRILKRFDITF